MGTYTACQLCELQNNVKPLPDIETYRATFAAREQHLHDEREQHRHAALAAATTAIRTVAPRYPAVQRVYLFGSVTKPGTMRRVSDVYVAVEGTLSAAAFSAL